MISFLMGLFGGDAGVYQTVERAKQLIYYALREPKQRVRQRAENLIRFSEMHDTPEEVSKIFEWVKSHYGYALDPRGIEYIKSPEVIDEEITKHLVFIGDCDDVAVYLAALFRSIGYDVRLNIITPARSQGENFQHIYPSVRSIRTGWIALDATAKGQPMGWEAPAKRKDSYPL